MLEIDIRTRQKTEMVDITDRIRAQVQKAGIRQGLCMVYVPHTTAGITINESADPSVAADILMVLNEMVPWKAPYRHLEGNSPAHIKASLVGASQWVAIENAALALGTWQGIFLCEFDGPRNRKVWLNLNPFAGEPSQA
jgi:secondary thiamine-phosphate synthase enzyme